MRLLVRTPVRFFCSVLVLLVACNADRLIDPPYWDSLTALFPQGLWLKENHFNLIRLAQAPHYLAGGPKLYLFNLVAPAFGVLSGIFSPPTVFLIFHLFNLACAALAMTLFFHILRRELDERLALLWTAAAAVDPIWNGQTMALYVEIPVAAFMALSIYSFWRGRFAPCAAWCIFAYFIKISAVLLATAYAAFAVYALAFNTSARPHWKKYAILLIPVLVLIVLEKIANYGLRPSFDVASQIKNSLFIMGVAMPSTLFLLAVNLGLVPLYLKDKGHHDLVLLLAILSAGFFLGFLTYPAPIVRYSVPVLFPLMTLAALVVSRVSRQAAVSLAVLFIVYGVINQNGRLLPPLPARNGRDGHYLERSREFLKDLDANRELCTLLERNFPGRPIVCKPPFTQMVSHPELGYVHQPLHLQKDFASGDQNIFIYASNIYENTVPPPLRPRDGECLIFDDRRLNGFLVAYEKCSGRNDIGKKHLQSAL